MLTRTLIALLLCAAAAHAQEARQVTASTLNVRSGPGTGYSILGTAAGGQKYVVVATSGAWKKIYWAGNTAWIYGAYTTSTTGTGVKIASAANVRSGPGTTYGIVGSASAGQIYVLATTSSGWKQVWFGGAGRWVYASLTTAQTLTGSSPSGSQRYYPTAYELDIFRRTVMAESGGEPYSGQVAVAAVILNRIASPSFPNTMSGVIFQPWQFTPATTGAIWNVTPSQSVKNACQAALDWSDPSYGALYFYSWCAISPPSWAYTKTWTATIGCHKFYK